jgi:cellulose synthase (UDP-forming)
MKIITFYESMSLARKCLVITFLLVAIWYLTWRLGTFNKDALFISYLLYAAELYGFITTLMHIFMTWRLSTRKSLKPEEGLSVDVLITTYNEPVSLLRKTLLTAKNIDYPHQTWLLDDGKRPEMVALARELGCQYLSRNDNRDAKAGNLNNALLYSKAEFIAVFDADHAPKRDFLTRTLGYFKDASVAFVQTPQDFYNLDSFQHHKKNKAAPAWHEQTVFFRIIQRGKDYWNSAFFCGSCAVIRRSSLDAIGGFATGTVTEDLHTSVRIHKKGFRSVYHADPLAYGLAPSGLVPFLKQRIRWGQGGMQVWRKEGIFFCRGLTIPQRINYLASTLTYFDGWQKGIFYIMPAIVLTTGIMPIITLGPEFLMHFIPYFLLTFWVFEEVNRGYGRSVIIEQYNMARFAAMAWSTLGFFKKNIKFAVTPKSVSSKKGFRSFIFPQVIILAGNGFAIPIGLFLYFQNHHLPINGLIANIMWSSVNSLLAISIVLFAKAYSRFKRSDYRFQIPLPAVIQFPNGEEFYGTIDDISSAGFRIYSSLPADTTVNTKLNGKIYLPTGLVKFDALIKVLLKGISSKKHFIKALGCSFVWKEKTQMDKLNLFLYGTDMQLSLNDFQESIRTPLDWLAKKLNKIEKIPDQNLAHWNAIVYKEAEQTEVRSGLISLSKNVKESRKLISFTPIPDGKRLMVKIYSRKEMSIITGKIAGPCQQIETPVSPLFINQFTPDQPETNSRTSALDHRSKSVIQKMSSSSQ